MITITTINNSWYFLGDLVIKPNSSSAYQEENLSKNQAKDLLESVSSKRVSLSSEDLIKVQNRYDSFNSGGNVDLSGIISKIENIYKDDVGGVRSGVLVDETDERIAADLDITEALSHKASLGGDGKILSEQLPDVVTAPDWSSISSKPTTLSGYGITDAYTKTQVDTAISGISGTGGAIPRPKFAGGTKRYLTGVWHDFTFGWVSPPTSFSATSIGGGNAWFYPFIPLENCVVSNLGISTGSNFAGNIKLGFYDSNSAAKPNNKLFGSSLISTAVANTVVSASTGGISVTAGNLYWIALFSQSGGNPSLVFCNNSLFPMLSAGYANTSPTHVYGYVVDDFGFGILADLPTFPAGGSNMPYLLGTSVPRFVFKISS